MQLNGALATNKYFLNHYIKGIGTVGGADKRWSCINKGLEISGNILRGIYKSRIKNS
jgi:hypothetical protein